MSTTVRHPERTDVKLRDALGADARQVHARVDEVLDNEDAVIILIDRRRRTSYLQGFGLSGEQLELLSLDIERALDVLASTETARERRPQRDDADECVVDLHRRRGDRGERGRGGTRWCGTVRDDDARRSARRLGAGAVLRLANPAAPADDAS
jgi:hypothetical protein